MKKFMMFSIVICLFATFMYAGIEWTATITNTGKAKNQNNEMTSIVSAQAGNLKQMFKGVQNESPFFAEGGYWLFKAEDENIYIVNDKKKSYSVIPLDTLLQMTGMMGQMVKIEITEPSIKTEVLPEETVLGYSCNHVKITTDYTMKIKILFIKQTSTVHEEREIWATSKIQGLRELNAAFLKKNFKTGIADLDDLIAKEMKSQKDLGFPLKTITKTTSTTKGKSADSVNSMIVTNIGPKNFPNSFFEIPESYSREEMGVPGEEGSGKKKKFGIF